MLRVYLIVLLVSLVSPAVADNAADEWRHHGGTFAEQRFSPLKQITDKNIAKLGLTWSFATSNHRGMEATPIVLDGVMYITTAWSRVYALNAKTGQQLWHFDPKVAGTKARDTCCDVVNRGVAVADGRVFLGALDGRLIALDAATGVQVWTVQTTDPDKPYTITGAPRVVRDKVIIGNGGAEFGVRGYFAAYDIVTGKQIWRFYTVPPAPHLALEHQELEIARRSWPAESLWETGLGGTVWDSFAYDADLDLLYVGVGNSSPYNRDKRSPGGGDNLFLSSILAVKPDTGRLVWYYQTTPGESWDYTATQHMILAELEIHEETRQVLMQAPKNGFFYVLDRKTGELISANNYVPTNWASHIDPVSGRPVETGKGDWSQQSRMVTPAPFGGHNWHPMAYSPQTGLVYLPTRHNVYPYTPDLDFKYNPGTFNTGEDWAALAGISEDFQPQICSPTRLTAWDPVLQKKAWEVKFDRGVNAGVLATAGGLVFQGTTDGRLVAYADVDGEQLWQQSINVGIIAPPISYKIDGEQYVAVLAGIGGSDGGHSDILDNDNPGHVFAFKLGGIAQAPDVNTSKRIVTVDDSLLDNSRVDEGRELYGVHCMRCHGGGAKSSGLVPDLRLSLPAIHSIWPQIVLHGVYASNGMASFADVLNQDEVSAIHAYVIHRALDEPGFWASTFNSIAGSICIPVEWLAD